MESITMRQQSQEKELISIRKRLNEMQMETDEKTVIGQFDIVFYIAREVLLSTPTVYMNVNRMRRCLPNLRYFTEPVTGHVLREWKMLALSLK